MQYFLYLLCYFYTKNNNPSLRILLAEFTIFSFLNAIQVVLLALIAISTATPSPQTLLAGLAAQPLLARYAPAPEAPASTEHATHFAAVAPVWPDTYPSAYHYATPYAFVSLLYFLQQKLKNLV